MKKNKLINSDPLRQMLDDLYDWTKHPEGSMYYNPYFQRWKRGRPSKEAYELRDWARGWDLYFYEAYPHLRPRNPMMEMLSSMIDHTTKLIKKTNKKNRTVLVKYRQRFTPSTLCPKTSPTTN